MKSLTFSCLICALNLYFAQKFLRTANLLEVVRTAKSCPKPKSCSKVAEHNRERPTNRLTPLCVYRTLYRKVLKYFL